MNYKLKGIKGNMKYKIITNKDSYILDMERTLWLIPLPFLFWFLPLNGHKIDEQLLKDVHTTGNKKGSNLLALTTVGVLFFLLQFLKPLLFELNINTPAKVNIALLFICILLGIIFRIFMFKSQRKKLRNIIDLETLPTITLIVRPKRIAFYYIYILCFICIWGVTILTAISFVDTGNIIILLVMTMFLLLGMIFNLFVLGTDGVKVKRVK